MALANGLRVYEIDSNAGVEVQTIGSTVDASLVDFPISQSEVGPFGSGKKCR